MLCRQCGFDQSANYERYPTFTTRIAPAQSPAYRKALRSELADCNPLQCPRCQSDKLIVYAEKGMYVCAQCHNLIPIDAAHKIDRSPSPRTEHNARKNESPEPVEKDVTEAQAVSKSSTAKRSRKIFALAALLAVVVALIFLAKREQTLSNNYETAYSLYTAGEYEEAKAIFESLGDYENSADWVKSCDHEIAIGLYSNDELQAAKAIFESLGDYEDSAAWAKRCDYKYASELYDGGNYSDAKTIFESLNDYGTYSDWVKSCDYRIAADLYDNGRYEEAKAIFESIDSYANSATYIKDCDYEIASELYKNGEYEEAKAIFESLGLFRDSATMKRACAEKLR